MRPGMKRHIGVLVVALIGFAALPVSAQTQPGGTPEAWIDQLAGLETAPELDLVDLRQQLVERVKSRTEPVPGKRPPAVPQLLELPQLVADIQFDEDVAVVRPASYRTLGRIADTLYHPSMLSYKFLIVGHTASGGRRDHNLTLSQRRADAVRDVLIRTFKVSAKRLQAVGLGEEQFLDRAHPTAPINARLHIMTVGKMP